MKFDAATIAAISTVIAAIVTGYFGVRAAARAGRPSPQDAINSGFTALTKTQLETLQSQGAELKELRDRVDQQDDRIEAQAGQIRELQHKESRYQRITRMLVEHVHQLRELLVAAGQPVPDEPAGFAELSELLARDGDTDGARDPRRRRSPGQE